jgi:hypothetical protein
MDEHEARTEASTPVQADARDYARTLRYAVEDDAEWAKKLAAKMTGSEAERAAIIVGATLSMALGRNAYAFRDNTQRGHTAPQKGYEQMNDERVAEILGRYQDQMTQFDPAAVEEALTHGPVEEQQELAEALAHTWRRDHNEPGFNQPPHSIVHEVERIIGEPMWVDVHEGAETV